MTSTPEAQTHLSLTLMLFSLERPRLVFGTGKGLVEKICFAIV